MPRHRIETPRQRTLWPGAVRSARRVPVDAAGRRGTPGHAKPSVALEWRQRLNRSQRRMLKRAGRRLLVSPWFAAGAGVVIAAGAVIYVPHAQLDPAINITHCELASCKQLAPQAITPMQAAPGKRVALAPSPSSVVAGMTFSYQVMNQSSRYGFSMLITIHAPNRISDWKLAFVIPGATDVYVVPGEALWRPSGTDGGTASNFSAGTESAGYAAFTGRESGGEAGSSRTGYTVQFQVRGSGTASRPSHCFYDGMSCTFKLVLSPDPVGLPGQE